MSALEYDATWPRCIRCECLRRDPKAFVERNGLLFCADESKCTETIRERPFADSTPTHRAASTGEKP